MIKLPSEIVIPFALSASGGIASTRDAGTQQMQHVSALVGTKPGERVMLPGYGVASDKYVFSSGTSIAASQISRDVMSKLAVYEPGVPVHSVTPRWSPEGLADIEVDFEGAPAVSGAAQTATIHAGGTVSFP